MMKTGWLAVAMIVVAALQAWDSHVLQAEGFIQALAVVGVLLPGLAVLVSGDTRVRGAAVALAAALFVTARWLSAVRLPELALAAFFPAILLLLDHTTTISRRARDRSA